MPRQDAPKKPDDTAKPDDTTKKVEPVKSKEPEVEKKVVLEKQKEVQPMGFEREDDLIEKVRTIFKTKMKERYSNELIADLMGELEFQTNYQAKVIELMKAEVGAMAQSFNKKWEREWDLFHDVYKHATLVHMALGSDELTSDDHIVQDIREKALNASESILLIYNKSIEEQNTEKYVKELQEAVTKFKSFDLLLISKGLNPEMQMKQIEMLLFSKEKPDEKVQKEVDAIMMLKVKDQEKALKLLDIIYRCTDNLGASDKKALNEAWRNLIYAAGELERLVRNNQYFSNFRFHVSKGSEKFGSDFSSGLKYIFDAIKLVNQNATVTDARVAIMLTGIRAMKDALAKPTGPTP